MKNQTRCIYCNLPIRIHFAWCQESGFTGPVPLEYLKEKAIILESRELRYCKSVKKGS